MILNYLNLLLLIEFHKCYVPKFRLTLCPLFLFLKLTDCQFYLHFTNKEGLTNQCVSVGNGGRTDWLAKHSGFSPEECMQKVSLERF